jgi:hypothetical protein
MLHYRNVAGDSGVIAYEIGDDYIKIKFARSSKSYTYSYNKAGKVHVESMKQLAENGRGLSTYISKYAKDLYE